MMIQKEDRTRTTIYVNKDDYKELKKIAIDKGTSVTTILEELVKDYIEKNKN